MRLCLTILVALVSFWSCPRSINAQAIVHLSDANTIYRLDHRIGVFIDSAGNADINAVSSDQYANRFHTIENNLSFGYLAKPIWLRIRTSATPELQWYLELPAPFLEYVDFYQRTDSGQWQIQRSGYYLKQSEKAIPHTAHVFPLSFVNNQSDVYVRITGQSPKAFQVLVMSKERWHEKVRWEDVSYGIFFGILLVMFFYNLFIYFSLRMKSYLLYIGTIVCTFFIFSSAAGYATRFLWPENPELNFYAGRLSLPFLTSFLTLFSLTFLEVKKYSRFLYFVLLSMIPVSIIAAALILTGILPSAGNNLISVSVVLYLTTGIVCRIKGNSAANFYIAAWSIYMIGGLLLTLRNSGVFVFNFWTTHFVEIGACLETVIIALALADRYRRLRREKEEAQLLALKIQTDANEILETKVKERTIELSKAYEDLHTTLERNQEQTRIIENKNAELDSFFYRISHDLKGPISSLLGLANLARHEVTDQQATFYLEKQQQQIHRLNSIINGLIKLTRLSDTNLEKQRIDFHALVDGCISSLNEHPNFSRIHFHKHIDDGVELHSEWTLLNAIVQNLIENGIKYCRDDSPTVKVGVRADNGFVLISVQDNGQGIDVDHQSKIFEMFYRATNNGNGSGLGLYILKRSVDRLNGHVDLKSEKGVGSTFTVRIPQ